MPLSAVRQTLPKAPTDMNVIEVLDSITDGVIIFDRQWHYLYVNNLAVKLIGRKAKDVIGKNISEVFPDYRTYQSYREYRKALRTGKSVHFETFNQALQEWYRVNAYPFDDGLVVYFEDVTDRKEAEDNIRRSKTWYKALFDTTLDGILIVDDSGTYIDVNESYARMLKTPRSKLIGANFATYIPDNMLNKAKQAFASLKKTGTFSGEFALKANDSSIVELEWTSKGNFLPGLHLCVARDINVRKTIERKLVASEELYRAVVEHATDLISLLNPDGGVVYASPSHQKMLGYSVKELARKNLFSLVHPDDLEVVTQTFKKSIHKGKSPTVTVRMRHKNGKWVYIEGTSTLVRDEVGKPKYLLAVLRDITERKQVEDQLKKSEELFRSLTSHAPVGIFLTDARGNCEFVNQKWSQIAGLSQVQAKGRGWVKALHPEDKKRVFHEWYDAAKKGEAFSSEYRFQRADGKVTWLSGSAITLKDSTGSVTGYLGTITDIDAQKHLQESFAYLAETSKALASSLDYKATLHTIAKMAVPHIADWCGVDLLDQDGQLRQVAVAHKDPNKVAWAKELRKVSPPDMSATTGLPNVIRTGKAEYYPIVTDEMLVQTAKNKKMLKLLRDLKLRSAIIAPLTVQGKTVGAISFVSSGAKNQYTQADVHMAEQLASRASSAIENASLYERVERERERLNNLVGNVPGVVWEAYGQPDQSTQRIDFVSRYVVNMLGYTTEQWLKTPNFWLEIVHPEDKEQAAREAAAIYKGGVGGTSRFRWLTKGGETRWVEAQSTVIKDEKGKVVGMRGVTMDITERMLLERRKDDFISMASHELKTPLTSVKVFTQILEKLFLQANNGQAVQYLRRMDDQLSKLANLINDLLNVSRIQTGKLALRKEHFSLQSLVNDTVETFQATGDAHHIVIQGQVTRQVYADKDRIGQVLSNLLSNALKYSTSGKDIIVSLETKENDATVSVRDFGIGITKEHLPRIFERFYQVDDANGKVYPGLGMGLFISHEIIARHGGVMWVKSSPGKGSTFSFSIPLSRANGGRAKSLVSKAF